MDSKTGLMETQHIPLIAPKHFREFTPEAYQDHIKSMYCLRQKGSKPVKPSFAEGIALCRNKKGTITIRRAKKKRSFEYVTKAEITDLAKGYGFTVTEVWNAFSAKQWLIADSAENAVRINKDQL